MAKNEGYKNRRNDLVFKTLVCVGPYDRTKGKERKGKERKGKERKKEKKALPL
jgi:hypothetical protein